MPEVFIFEYEVLKYSNEIFHLNGQMNIVFKIATQILSHINKDRGIAKKRLLQMPHILKTLSVLFPLVAKLTSERITGNPKIAGKIFGRHLLEQLWV